MGALVDTEEVVGALGALAQETRLDAFRLLVQAGPGGVAAGELAARLGVPPATLSFHLSQLREAGLARSHRQSRSVIYAANFERMNALVGFLTRNCCAGLADAAEATPDFPAMTGENS